MMLEWMLGYVIVLMFIIYHTGSYKKYLLHWLFITFFIVSALLKTYIPEDSDLFVTVHIVTFMALIIISEIVYRLKKYKQGLKANLFPIFLSISFFVMTLARQYLEDTAYFIFHSAFVIFVTTSLVTIPILADSKKYRWLKQFLF